MSDRATPHSQRSFKSFSPNPLTKYFQIILSVDAVKVFASPESLLRLRDQERSGRWELESEDHDRYVNERKDRWYSGDSYVLYVLLKSQICLFIFEVFFSSEKSAKQETSPFRLIAV